MPQLLMDMHDKAAEVRGTACYAISMGARLPAFAPNAVETASRAAQLVAQTRGRNKKKSEASAQAAADNALSVLIEVLLHHTSQLNASSNITELWNAWIAGLPCQVDESEGIRNIKALLQLVQRQEPGVVGNGGSNLHRVLCLLVDAYKTDMADDATSSGIGQLLIGVGEAQLQQYVSQFTPKQQRKVHRILTEGKNVVTA